MNPGALFVAFDGEERPIRYPIFAGMKRVPVGARRRRHFTGAGCDDMNDPVIRWHPFNSGHSLIRPGQIASLYKPFGDGQTVPAHDSF